MIKTIFGMLAPALAGYFTCYFGGGGGSSSSANTTNNIDKRLALSQGAIGASGDNNTITVTDSGIVSRALDTVDKSNAIQGEGLDSLIKAGQDLFNQSQNLIGQTQKSVADAYEQANLNAKGAIDNRTIIVLAVAGVAGLFALRKGK